jgi:hypothetical protein
MTETHQGFHFRLRRGASIGELDAESDGDFLSSCFVDTGDFETLKDCRSPHRIIVGRTGSGKTALINHLVEKMSNVIIVSPENLSLNYLSNSDILVTLEKAGVKLDIFYGLLWKHVFAVELLKRRCHLTNEEKTRSWIAGFIPALKRKDQAKERAFDYLSKWGNTFWQETEYRVKEVTEKLEGEITSKLGADIGALKADLSGGIKRMDERKTEVVNKAQTVINSIQIKALADVIALMNEEIFTDPQQKYYLVIDRLDENWVDDDLRYRLIRALIECVKTFRSVVNVKIIVALRQDLIQTVFKRTRDAGFQEEKYAALFLQLRWEKALLIKMVNERVIRLVREQYTLSPVELMDLFPKKIGKEEFVDYLLERTHYRPRDAISFVNECLKRSEGKGQVTVQTVRNAEIEYSAARMNALGFEWVSHFPSFLEYLPLIEQMPNKFRLSQIHKDRINEFSVAKCFDGEHAIDPVIRAGFSFINNDNAHAFRVELIKALYAIGVVGLKLASFNSQIWAYMDINAPGDGQIRANSEVFIHPMAWARLGVKPN